jgi:hypothetical protein
MLEHVTPRPAANASARTAPSLTKGRHADHPHRAHRSVVVVTVGDRLGALLQRNVRERALRRDSGETVAQPAAGRVAWPAPRVLQRLPVVTNSDARKRVRAEFMVAGRKTMWDQFGQRLVDGIGAVTIEQVGARVVMRLMDEQGNNVAAVVRAINLLDAPQLVNLQVGSGSVHKVHALGAVRQPTETEVVKAYATRLSGALAAGPAPYAAANFGAFRDRMLNGEIWDFGAGAWTPISTALLAVHTPLAPVDGAAFAAQRYGGQGVVGWQNNPHVGTRLELQSLLGVPVAVNRPFNDATRAAIAQIAAHPAGAQRIVADGVAVTDRLTTWLDFLIAAAVRATAAARMDPLLAKSDGAVGMNNVLNHLDDLLPMATSVDALHTGALANRPFTRNVLRAGALRGHFVKHVLGVQAPPHDATGRAEAVRWLGILGLAPNGLINRASLPALTSGWYEWAIFRQHAQYQATYRLPWTSAVGPAERPTNATEVNALTQYFQSASAGAVADATTVATAHEALYEHHVSTAFDAARAPGNRFLYYDAHTVKVNAQDATLFMVAAWNGNTFDLSTGFIPAGGPAAQYNQAWAQRMLVL